jgi:hypothetical protein
MLIMCSSASAPASDDPLGQPRDPRHNRSSEAPTESANVATTPSIVRPCFRGFTGTRLLADGAGKRSFQFLSFDPLYFTNQTAAIFPSLTW